MAPLACLQALGIAACLTITVMGCLNSYSNCVGRAGSPQEEGESNNWVGYAKGLMLPVRSPREARMHGEGLDEAAAQLPLPVDADAEQRQPQSSCWQKVQNLEASFDNRIQTALNVSCAWRTSLSLASTLAQCE